MGGLRLSKERRGGGLPTCDGICTLKHRNSAALQSGRTQTWTVLSICEGSFLTYDAV